MTAFLPLSRTVHYHSHALDKFNSQYTCEVNLLSLVLFCCCSFCFVCLLLLGGGGGGGRGETGGKAGGSFLFLLFFFRLFPLFFFFLSFFFFSFFSSSSTFFLDLLFYPFAEIETRLKVTESRIKEQRCFAVILV